MKMKARMFCLAAYWMARGAPPLMRIAYPENTEPAAKKASPLEGKADT